MEAFKSFKAYQYFADGFVANVCTQKLHREDCSLVTEGTLLVSRSQTAFPSLRSGYGETRTLLCISEGQDSIHCSRCACTCVAGKEQAYIHIAALLFYLEDSAMVWSDTLPPHNSETNIITSPRLIPINTLNVLWCLQQHRICLTRCILGDSFIPC